MSLVNKMAPYIILFWLKLLMISTITQGSDICDGECVCFGGTVDCTDKGLKTIPSNIPEWTEELVLSQNPGLQLEKGSLAKFKILKKLYLEDLGLKEIPRFGKLKKVKKLSLAGNHLDTVSDEWRQDFPSLKRLDLSRNKFKTFDMTQFSDMPLHFLSLDRNQISTVVPSKTTLQSLIELRLSRNQISNKIFNASQPFPVMANLTILDLSHNKFHRINAYTFGTLSQLRTLKIKENHMTNLDDGAFHKFTNMKALYLDNNNLTTINKAWTFQTGQLKTLSLTHNNIDTIEHEAWSYASNIEQLYLSHNELVSLNGASLHKLKYLRVLHLSHNSLSFIESGVFNNTPRLDSLDLSYNDLRWSVEDDSGAFRHLHMLNHLNLAHNNFETIEKNAFKHLNYLSELNLMGNEIRTFSNNTFEKLKNLEILKFNSSSFVCNCLLVWISSWLNKSTFKNTHGTCKYPPELKGTSIYYLKEHKCVEDVARPIITSSPEDQMVFKNNTLILQCVAESPSDGDKPVFVWRKNNKLVLPYQIDQKPYMTVEHSDGKGGVIYNVTSVVTIKSATFQDSGTYQCEVRNSYGPTFSKKAKVDVYIFPYFVKVPNPNVDVQLDGTVEMICEAQGHPPPELTLEKVGKFNFPAATDKRMMYIPELSKFIINKVKPRDNGAYVFIAKSKAGEAKSYLNITVKQTPPKITQLLGDRSIIEGNHAFLQCEGEGFPVPNVNWLKDDEKILNTDHYLIFENNKYLLILNTKISDSGAYVCELSNEYGKVKQQIDLVVTTTSMFENLNAYGITIALFVCTCSVSLVWLTIVYIVYNTRKKIGMFKSDPLITHTPNMQPITTRSRSRPPQLTSLEGYAGVPVDSGSEHSSGKDSGVGEPSQRSNDDYTVPNVDFYHTSRRSRLFYNEPEMDSLPRGLNHMGVSNNGDANHHEGMRPRLSSFRAQQHLSVGNYGTPYHTASLRRGSSSHLYPTPIPVVPDTAQRYTVSGCHIPHADHCSGRQITKPKRTSCTDPYAVPVHIIDKREPLCLSHKDIEPISPNEENNYQKIGHYLKPTASTAPLINNIKRPLSMNGQAHSPIEGLSFTRSRSFSNQVAPQELKSPSERIDSIDGQIQSLTDQVQTLNSRIQSLGDPNEYASSDTNNRRSNNEWNNNVEIKGLLSIDCEEVLPSR